MTDVNDIATSRIVQITKICSGIINFNNAKIKLEITGPITVFHTHINTIVDLK